MMREEASWVLLLNFVRLRELGRTTQSVQALRRSFPNAKVAAVATPATWPALKTVGADGCAIFRRDGWAGAWRLVAGLRRMNLAAVFVAYDRPDRRGHLKLELLALLVGAKRILAQSPGRQATEISQLRLGLVIAVKLAGLIFLMSWAAVVGSIVWATLSLAGRGESAISLATAELRQLEAAGANRH